jgi:hypothetical protein
MIAAMFSATMSTLSGDYNVMASVVTEDIYHRLFDKNASERRLVLVGRISTLLIGTLTIAIGIVLISTAQKGLFEVMVTVFGLFVGPMLIPMLVGLLSRRVTWRGAAAGIAAGFASGLSLYFYKTFMLAGAPGVDPNWLRYDFEAIAILVNFAMTSGAMLLVTLVERTSPQERARVDEFFARLSTPIDAEPLRARAEGEVFSPFYIIAWITVGTGLLLIGATLGQTSDTGWWINLCSGLALCFIGLSLYRLHRRFMRREAETPTGAGEAAPAERVNVGTGIAR